MTDQNVKWGQIGQELFKPIMKTYRRKQEENLVSRPKQRFITNSSYSGTWCPVEMEGFGIYTLPHGVIYEGQMRNGMFHGKGMLTYPRGQIITGEWYKGELVCWKYNKLKTNEFDLENYCKQPDRRFLISLETDLNSAGNENLTNQQPTRKIPEGCYDVVDGFFNPVTGWVHSAENFEQILYMPSQKETPTRKLAKDIVEDGGADFIRKIASVPVYKTAKWIVENCRKAYDEPTGHRPDLYEYWFNGTKTQRKEMQMRLDIVGGKFKSVESKCENYLSDFEAVAERQNASIVTDQSETTKSEDYSDNSSETLTLSFYDLEDQHS